MTAYLSQAQSICVPGTLTAPQKGYIIPDSATNLSGACVGQAYEQIIYIKAQPDTSISFNGSAASAVVDSFVVDKNVTGLPAGLSIASVPGFTAAAPGNPKTDFDRLIIKGDSMACIRISGTIPTGTPAGTYNLSIGVRAYLRVFGLIPIDTSANIGYYFIQVQDPPCWPASVGDISSNAISQIQVFPNPATDLLSIQFSSNVHASSTLHIYNTLGQIVYQQPIKIIAGDQKISVDTKSIPTGHYSFSIGHDKAHVQGRFSVAH